jgi:hypothetical protein
MFDDHMIHGTGPRERRRARVEHTTPLVPAAVARGVWSEASVYLGEELPRSWVPRLVAKAETLCAHNPGFRRRLWSAGDAGRDWLWAFMRHWLAARLHKHRPDLLVRLPAAYSNGEPLPQQHAPATPELAATDAQIGRRVPALHGLTEARTKIEQVITP